METSIRTRREPSAVCLRPDTQTSHGIGWFVPTEASQWVSRNCGGYGARACHCAVIASTSRSCGRDRTRTAPVGEPGSVSTD